jgi:hypothetical protein
MSRVPGVLKGEAMENPCHHLQRIDLFGPMLWLQYYERLLFSFNLNSREFQRETPPFVSAVDDFFLLPDGRIIVAMEKGDIWVNTSGNWEFLSDIPFTGLNKGVTRTPQPRVNHRGFGMIPKKERTYRIIIQGDYIVVLSPFNLYRFSLNSGEWEIIPLTEWISDAIQISVSAGPGNSLYVGFNRGELQGGLKLISGDTGRVVTIDGRQPVSGIVPDPCMNGNLVMSAGCCHRTLEFGGLYMICGNRMDPIYLDSAIFDIKTSGTSLVGAGNGSFLSYDGEKILAFSPGEFSEIKGMVCSDLSKNVFQVATDINSIVSGSGLTPLIAIRRN